MNKKENPPDWKENNLLNKGLKLFIDKDFKSIIHKINDKYLFWDKVKYQVTPKKTDSTVLWSAVKFSRTIHAKQVTFGKHQFSYNLTDNIQKGLHEFDLNIRGQLGSKGLIPDEDKKRYLISSIMEEAIASSQIEGAVTTRKKAKEMLRKSKKPKNKSEQMIVNNYNTIKYILELQNEPISKENLFKVHKLITHQTLENKNDEGRFREDNEINVIDVVNGDVVHYPPDFNEVPSLINELFSFFNEQDKNKFIHPIVKGCIIHFMIGYIHPFVDGNGRTARALYYWYLLKKGYWLTEYLSISRLIVKSKTQYANAFIHSEIDENDLTYFINYKLKTMSLAYESLHEYIQRKISEKKKYSQFQRIKGINERQAIILNWVYEEPEILLTVKEIENRLNVANQTSRNDLMNLVNKGYLGLIEINNKSKAFCKSDNFDFLLEKELPTTKKNAIKKGVYSNRWQT